MAAGGHLIPDASVTYSAGHGSAGADRQRRKRSLLLFSYAFPPMAVPMASYVAKMMVGCCEQGYAVDAVSAEMFHAQIGRDESLEPYVMSHVNTMMRLRPSGPVAWLRQRSRRWSTTPDPMQMLAGSARRLLEAMPLEEYAAVVTFSPFHAVNPVMVAIKQRRPRVRWVAQFGDPWANNPLERSAARRRWSARNEPETVASADRLLFTAPNARDLMLAGQPEGLRAKTAIVPHCWDPALYPALRPRPTDDKIRLRHIGTLFERRSPESLFQAIALLLRRRPELHDRLALELVGSVPSAMLATAAARALPPGLVTSLGIVPYLRSLELMNGADILVLIEPDVASNLFVPSKAVDYLGSGRPIVALAPPGGSRDLLARMNAWQAGPSDVAAIADCLEDALRYVECAGPTPWYAAEFRDSLRHTSVARLLLDVVEDVAA
jgi:glycosyltransferase involved in cell wall biosynthesis